MESIFLKAVKDVNGDYIGFGELTPDEIAVLTGPLKFADGTQQTTAAVSAAVQSVFSRTGAVVAVAGDYDAAKITVDPANIDGVDATNAQLVLEQLGLLVVQNASDLVYRGLLGFDDADPTPQAQPGPTDYYIFNTAGTRTVGDAAGATVQIGDWFVFHRASSTWRHLDYSARQNTAVGTTYDPTGNVYILGADVQTALDQVDAALVDVDGRIDALENEPGGVASFNTRTGDVLPTAGDYTAAQTTFSATATLVATDVQAAIEELDAKYAANNVDGHINDPEGAHAASAISYAPPVAPVAPTVNPLITNDVTPVLSGSAALEAGHTLTVSVNGATYAVTPDASGNWMLDLGEAAPISGSLAPLVDGQTYSVTATVTNTTGATAVDATENELKVDTTAPSTPTVNALTANTLTPVITGNAIVGAGESLTVTVSGATYAVTPAPDTSWSVDLATAVPASGTLTPLVDGQVYSIVATTKDAANNSSTDLTSNELTISMAPPPPPPGWVVQSLVFVEGNGFGVTPPSFPFGEQYFGVDIWYFQYWEHGVPLTTPPPYSPPVTVMDMQGQNLGVGTYGDLIQAVYIQKSDGTFIERRRDASWTFKTNHAGVIALSIPNYTPADYFFLEGAPGEERWSISPQYTGNVFWSFSENPGVGQPSPAPTRSLNSRQAIISNNVQGAIDELAAKSLQFYDTNGVLKLISMNP